MRNKNTYRLTEGAVLLAIFTVLLLITLYIPGLGFVVNLFLALPFMMFAAKHGWKSTAIFTIAAVLLSLVVGTLLAVPLALAYGITGMVMGAMIKEGKSRLAVFVAGSLVFLANTVIQYIVAVALFKINFIEEMMASFREAMEMSTDIMGSLGQTADDRMLEQLETTIDLIETLMPSMFVMASFMIIFIIQLVSFPILKRFGIAVPRWKPFREMTLPKSLLWYYLLSMIATMVFQPEAGSYWYWALANLVFILQFFMLLQGLSFVAYFTHMKKFPKAFLIIAVILTFLLPFVLYIVRILGIIDLGFNLRKRLEEKK